MTTLKDLSRHLGISVTQVSRALNDHADVAEDTKERVRAAALELNYQPNVSARRLVTGRSGIVGLVLHGVPRASVSAHYMQLMGNMSSHFARAGLQFVLHVADENEDKVTVYRKLLSSGSIDGFVLFEPVMNDPRIAFLRAQGVPFVLHGRDREVPDYPFFDIDNEAVGYQLTRHLVEQGHRRIAFLNGFPERSYAVSRLAGYRRALSGAGIPYMPGLVRAANWSERYGLRDTVRIMDAPGKLPTAFIAGHALVARGALTALRALNYAVPTDISLVAHDDMLPDLNLAGFDPAITCTRAPLAHSWKPLVEFMVGALEGRPVQELQEIESPEFLSRDSVSAPVAAGSDSGAAAE